MEELWFCIPLISLLSQLGGKYDKKYRRLGIPVVVVLSALFTNHWSFHYGHALLFAGVFGAAVLPFTLIGDSLPEHRFNYVWVCIWAILVSCSGVGITFVHGLHGLFFATAAMFSVATAAVCLLSNVKYFRKIFQWKLCEAIAWGAGMVSVYVVLTNAVIQKGVL